MLVLQRIEVSKRVPLEEAHRLAKEHMTNKKKTFYTETKLWYKFRNATKKHCVPKSFQKKKIIIRNNCSLIKN